MSTQESSAPSLPAPDLDRIGGDTALDFINTLRADGGAPLDTLQTDGDVRAWMRESGLPTPLIRGPLPEGSLLENARRLRQAALAALEQSKAGKRVHLAVLNRYLSQSRSHLTLRRDADALMLDRTYLAETAEQALAPLAEAVATLLAEKNLSLVHRCAGAGCVLWFQDRPSGRPRRFCTEATCGIRTRVAAHRARRRNATL